MSYIGWLIEPDPIEPIATRSYISIAVAWRQPLFCSPSNQSAGMRTSVKKTSLKWRPPSIWWIGRISTPGALQVDDEHRDAGVLRLLGVGAGDEHAVLGFVRERGPHLLAVEDPLVSVALGAGLQAGDVGAGAGLGEHLAPHRLGRDVVGHEPPLLLLGAELVEDRQAHAVADHEAAGHRREVLGDGAVDALVLEREAGAAVLRGVREAGEAGRGELGLELARGLAMLPVARAGGVLGQERRGIASAKASASSAVRVVLGIVVGSPRLVLYVAGLYAAIQS